MNYERVLPTCRFACRLSVVVDYRSDPSDSAEGKGLARRAWEIYRKGVLAVTLPVLEPSIRRYARSLTNEMLGFWLSWHIYGGFEGLVEAGMHPSTVWRKVKRFRTAFGQHPDVFRLPGVEIDPAKYWDAARALGSQK